MKCPKCGHDKTSVEETRPYMEGHLRVRACLDCNVLFGTRESHSTIAEKMIRSIKKVEGRINRARKENTEA